MLNAQHGKIKFFDDVMATYRIHSQGVWGTKSVAYRLSHSIKVLDLLIDYFEGDVRLALLETQSKFIIHLVSEIQKTKEEKIFYNVYKDLPRSFFHVFNQYDYLLKEAKTSKLKKIFNKIKGKK